MNIPDHINWLKDTGKRLKTNDGKNIEVWELEYEDKEKVLIDWANHLRNHYCLDCDIDFLRGKKSKKEYLEDIKFPSNTTSLGPSVKSGDFGEILVADYLEWKLNFWVPRVRWSSKISRDESPKGCDVIGFQLINKNKASSRDKLAVFESKAKFSKPSGNRLQDAINDSAKDPVRIDESLNYIKQKLYEKGKKDDALKVERFQSPVDFPYSELYGAVALLTNEIYDESILAQADTKKIQKSLNSPTFIIHPNREKLTLIVIKGNQMMDLVYKIYDLAANEA
ncbi:Hachiman antiphage defense system protein HamA [Leptospira meyeri]|uniref:Hachiman antiphage defense system protein HamA n=1 Tax=Leptospira meyeri TaxID=29508 RepID=UPI000C2ADB22|nr:Hachiman antiphage defense system protein HamA [Leptospira meyeri]PJZ79275.1 virulence associated protein [Leptospira meyeri]PJZ95109.1 virulence associated protein [Leptospira meyeri]